MSYTGSKAQAGRGSALNILGVTGAGGSPPTTLIGEVKSSCITGAQWNTVDVTNFQSGTDQEFLTTVRTNGEVNIAGNRVVSDGGQALVETAYASGARYDFTLVLPKTAAQTTAGDTYAFSALVLSREFTVDAQKEIAWTVKLKISGAVTFTPGS